MTVSGVHLSIPEPKGVPKRSYCNHFRFSKWWNHPFLAEFKRWLHIFLHSLESKEPISTIFRWVQRLYENSIKSNDAFLKHPFVHMAWAIAQQTLTAHWAAGITSVELRALVSCRLFQCVCEEILSPRSNFWDKALPQQHWYQVLRIGQVLRAKVEKFVRFILL